MKRKICITLDYELYLGVETGSVQNTIIKPMDKLSDIFDKYNVVATLFVDASYLLALRKNMDTYEALAEDYKMIVSQLKKLQAKKYSIQLHIHPQWIYSTFDGKRWNMDFEHYKLSDLENHIAWEHFSEAKELLESIMDKKIIAFRAGGFSLQSFEGYSDLLVKNNIKIDSSVAPGKVSKSKYQWYDYKNIPLHKYKFSEDIKQISDEGEITEIPISVVKYNPFHYAFLRKKIELKNSFILFSEGQVINAIEPRCVRYKNLLKQFFFPKIVSASIDEYLSALLPEIFSKYKKMNKKWDFIIIGHPKLASPRSLYFIEKFIKQTIGSNQYVTIENLL